MKIAIIQGAFFPVPPLLGGAVEKIWFRIGQEFVALGHEVAHISRRHPLLLSEEIVGGVKHCRVSGYDQPKNLLKLKALDLLYSLRACKVTPRDSDIVVTNTAFSPFFLPKNLRSRAYVDVQRVPKGQMKYYASVGRLRACSQAIATAIKAELPARQQALVSCIPNPFPFDPPNDSDRISKSPQILYCGRIHPEKGMDILIKACAGLKWPVLLVGPQESRHGGGGAGYCDELRRMALEVGADVSLPGPVFDAKELSEIYNRAAIFVYPSVAEAGEAGPVAPREAMAWGCVPVVSALDCFTDFVQDGKNGIVFDHRSADAAGGLRAILVRLMEDAALRNRLSLEAAQVCQTHSPKHIAELFISDFQSVVAAHPRVPLPH